jgi:hypothetical protein
MSNHVLANTHLVYLEQIIECIPVLYVLVSYLQSCWMYMLRLTCGFGEHIAVESRYSFLREHNYSTLVNRIIFFTLNIVI